MNKKMRELLTKMEEARNAAKALKDAGEIDKAMAKLDEVDSLQKEYDVESRLYEAEKKVNEPTEAQVQTAKEPEPVSAEKAFADAARRGFTKAGDDLNETTDGDGGYTVPKDIQTRILERREAKASLLNLVDVESVSTLEGRRTFKKRGQQTGFSKVGEKGKIGAKNTPQFEVLEFKIDKYSGYFPVTNELLADSDANIANTLVEWIGDESRVTANKLILEAVASKSQTKLAGLDDIKKALNVTLGQAFKATSKIITNDDGLQYLDTLKDSDGKYLLQPNPANPMQLRLCAGATTVDVVVIPNADLATASSASSVKVPFIIGDLKEGIKYFDRQKTSIAVSNVASIGDLNAFEQDLTIYRAIEREVVKVKDAAAFVNGYIDTYKTA